MIPETYNSLDYLIQKVLIKKRSKAWENTDNDIFNKAFNIFHLKKFLC